MSSFFLLNLLVHIIFVKILFYRFLNFNALNYLLGYFCINEWSPLWTQTLFALILRQYRSRGILSFILFSFEALSLNISFKMFFQAASACRERRLHQRFARVTGQVPSNVFVLDCLVLKSVNFEHRKLVLILDRWQHQLGTIFILLFQLYFTLIVRTVNLLFEVIRWFYGLICLMGKRYRMISLS